MNVAHRSSLVSLFLLAGSAAFLGCNSGQIGGEVQQDGADDGYGTEGSDGCDEVDTSSLSPSDSTALGFDGQLVIDRLSGEHTASLVWNGGTQGDVTTVEVEPAAGLSSITLSITPDPSTLVLVDREPASTSATGGLIDMAGAVCSDAIRVEASVHVTTDNGALDDTFDATFTAQSANGISASIPIELGSLSGSFNVVESDTNSEAKQTTLTITVNPGGFSGRIGGVVETDFGEAVAASVITYAVFPEESCELGSWIDPESEFATTAIATLDELRAFDLTWESGETATLDLEHEVTSLCYEGPEFGGGESIVMQVSTAAMSSDGRIAGTWGLEGRVTLADDGTPASVALLRQAYMVDSYPSADFESSTGISGAAIADGAQGSFEFDVSQTLDEGTAASGSLAILELVVADCSDQTVVETEDGSVASPGCAGTTATELETATLTEREADAT